MDAEIARGSPSTTGVSQIILGLSDRESLNPLTQAFLRSNILVLAAELTSNEDFCVHLQRQSSGHN